MIGDTTVERIVIKGKVQTLDVIAIACNAAMLVLFLWIHIVYRLDMLFMIVPLTILEIYLFFFCLLPYEYVFCGNGLEIRHKLWKTQVVQYASVYDYEAHVKDEFLNVTENNEVKLYYRNERKYRMIKCYPSDVEYFVSQLKGHCSALHQAKTIKTC